MRHTFRICALVLAALALTSCTSCKHAPNRKDGVEVYNTSKPEPLPRMQVVSSQVDSDLGYIKVLKDQETGQEYLCTNDGVGGATTTNVLPHH